MRKFVLALCTSVLLFTASAAIVPMTVEGAAPAERVVCNEDGCTIFRWWYQSMWCGDDPREGASCFCWLTNAYAGDCHLSYSYYDGANSIACVVSGYNCTECVDNEAPEVHARHVKPTPTVDWTLGQ